MAFDAQTLNKVYDKTNGCCHLCRKKLSWNNYGSHGAKGAWHVDHSKAKANGGTHHMNNLFPACISCNIEKGTLHKTTIRKRKGYYKEKESSGCFISTACVARKGLPDDCYELQVLRKFRDEFVIPRINGQELISKYYNVAPLIVQQINKQNNAGNIYDQLFIEIKKAVSLIEHKMYQSAFELYCRLVEELEGKFLQKGK
jgi:hypothetical protein